MLKTILAFGVLLLLVSVGFAQQEKTSEQQSKGKILFKANTEFSAQVENEINAERTKIGEGVDFILTEDVKGEGSTIAKGSPLYGRVVNVEKASADNNNISQISVLFDFVKLGDDFVPLTAAIVSVAENPDNIKFAPSQVFDGGTVLSLKSKNLHLDKGRVFRIKLVKDITQK